MHEVTESPQLEPDQNSQPAPKQERKPPDIVAERQAIAARQYDNYDSRFTARISPEVKQKVMSLLNAGNQEKLKEIETIGGCLRLVQEDLSGLRGSLELRIKAINLILDSKTPNQEKIVENKARIEKLRIRILSLITIKRQLVFLLDEAGE